MNTKQLLFSTLILSVINNMALGMEKDTQYQIEQEMKFKHHMTQLDETHANFVKSFETWSKEDQDKMHTNRNGYFLDLKTAEAHKCDEKISRGFDFRFDEYSSQMTPFIHAINYLKDKNQ